MDATAHSLVVLGVVECVANFRPVRIHAIGGNLRSRQVSINCDLKFNLTHPSALFVSITVVCIEYCGGRNYFVRMISFPGLPAIEPL